MKIKCPVCGNIFEGPVQFCPSCGAKLAMPESASAQPAPAPAPAPAAAPAPAPQPQQQVIYVQTPTSAPAQAPEGSKGKAIGMGIASILLGLPSFVLEILVIVTAIIGAMAAWGSADPDLILENEFFGSIFAFGWLCVICLFVPMLLSFIFSLVAGKQGKVKGLTIPARIIGISGFVLFFLSIIAAIVGGIASLAGVFAATTTI